MVPGLEQADIMRFGYAVEYDFAPPTQLRPTLETRTVEGLNFAGQLNGTTGYEEAAGQGFLAGANAALKIQEKDPLVLDRSQAYLGVLIDDLVTKGVDEPYRMFTSRAEYRMLLRQDNADRRLTPLGVRYGTVSPERQSEFEAYERQIAKGLDAVKQHRHKGDHDYEFKKKHAEKFLKDGAKLKAYVFFKGRSIIYKDQGEILLLKLAQELEDLGKVEQMPKLEGKRMIMFIAPKKK